MIKIKYNSPAIPQGRFNVDINATYACEKHGKKYVVQGLNYEQELSLSVIKNMFKLCDGYSWDMLEEIMPHKEKSDIKTKSIKIK